MNLIIIGAQGSGKGTQAKFLSDKFNAVHLDLGEVLRIKAKEDSELGKELREIIHVKKELVSDEVIMKILSEEFGKMPLEKGIILDGAPRKIEQIGEVESAFLKSGRKIDKVVFINVNEEESIDRVSKRYRCSKCHRHFELGENLNSPSDLCPDCLSPVEQRKDDTPDGIKKRLSIFKSQTHPVIEYYRKEGVLVEVDGMKDKQEVFAQIVDSL